ncbi:hypothetical protein QEW_4399 [Clostridioides difficile CD160]|nr:hypothetical protein QEW_4399 [Clostridioides difficile CD160]
MDGMQIYLTYIKNILKEIDNYSPKISITEAGPENIATIFKTVSDINELLRIYEYENKDIKRHEFLSNKIPVTFEETLLEDIKDEKVKLSIKKHCGDLLASEYKIKEDFIDLHTKNTFLDDDNDIKKLLEKGLSLFDIKMGNKLDKFNDKIETFIK